jgi:gamma-glutamyltranspeptidase/glutathione hydrolase
VDVHVERLLSERYAGQCSERVKAALAAKRPVDASSDGRPAGGTVHLTAMDAAGLSVALTLTHGEAIGAQVAVPGLGLILGHGMSRFDPRPRQANSPGPGKRPLHNMCPTVVTRGGRPILALGAAGGRRIPNTLFDVLLGRVGEGRSLAEAVAAPRQHTEGGREVWLEKAWPVGDVKRLAEIGYTIKVGGGASLNAIERDPETGVLRAAAR